MRQKLFLFFILFLPVVSSFSQPLSLVSPKNNYVTSDTSIIFQWNKLISGSFTYEFQIATDINFTQNLQIFTLLALPEKQLIINTSNKYFWRIRGFDGITNTNWSTTWAIQIFKPSDISGLELWLSADSGITKDGSNLISQWNDLSGNNNHAIQPVTDQPLFLANGINSRPAVDFQGTVNLPLTSNIDLDSFSIFIVEQTIDDVIMVGNSSTNNQVRINQSGNYNLSMYSSPYNPSSNLFTTPQSYYNIAVYKGGAGLVQFFEKDLARGTSVLFGTNINGINIYPTNGKDFKIAEIIVFNRAVNTTDQTSIVQYLLDKYCPPVNLGRDINIDYGFCNNILDAGSGFDKYLWNTSETTPTINAVDSGWYSVTTTNIFGENSIDSVFILKPVFNINDTSFCKNDSVTISAGLGNTYSYQWSTLESTESITIHTGGTYFITVSDSLGCSTSTSVNVIEDMFASTTSLGPDKAICSGDTLRLLVGGAAAISYLWSGGSTNNFLVVNTAGPYSVTVTNAVGCKAMDTINLSIQGLLPAPDFFYDSVCVGSATPFSDASTIPLPYHITSWLWNFDDPVSGLNNSSSLQNPSHTFTHAGVFYVRLITTSDSGCVKSIIKPITVFSLPLVNFSPTNGCNGLSIQFTDKSTNAYGNITGWLWDFGDGTPNSTAVNPIHTFDTVGTYQITLAIITEVGCSKSVIKTITIRKSPDVGFTFTKSCAGNAVYFADTTQVPPWSEILAWHWDFGGGHTDSIPNPNIVFDSAGIYPVTLTITSLNGCVVSVTKQDTVHAIPLVDFSYADICAGKPYQFYDYSTVQNDTISHWQWQFGNLGSSAVKNPTFVFPNTGSYIIKLAVSTDAGCMDSTMRNAVVNAVPSAEFSFNPPYGISPLNVSFTDLSTGGVNYLWSFGDGPTTSTLENPSHLYLVNGIYSVSLITTNQYGCSDTIIHEVRIIPSSVDIVVTKVYASIISGYLKLGADLMNNGTRRITEINMDSHVDGGFAYRENWGGLLDPGGAMHYDFTTQLAVSPSKPTEYVCVEAVLPIAEQETNLANNELCFAFTQEFTCLDPYPNPASDLLNIYYILPFDDNVEILLYDSKGSQLKTIYSGAATEGLNQIVFDVTGLSKGIYAYKINFRDKSIVKKFMKE